MHDRLIVSDEEEYDVARLDEELEDQTVKECGKEKQKREYIICKKIMKFKKEGKKKELMTNVLGQPIGETSVDIQTYMGYLAHKKVPLSIHTWPKMLDFVLEVDVLQTFEGKVTWSIVMESINKKWCDHKSKMISNVIYKFLDNEKFRLAHPKALMEPPKNCETTEQD